MKFMLPARLSRCVHEKSGYAVAHRRTSDGSARYVVDMPDEITGIDLPHNVHVPRVAFDIVKRQVTVARR
jgi:hypothetical protein